jgi:hypothetical protein
MKQTIVVVACAVNFLLSASPVFAQAFGEYGRAIGSIPHGQGVTGSRSAGGDVRDVGSGGVGEIGGRKLPLRLEVVSKSAGLFVRQDEESERILQLNEGQNVVPMVRSEGKNEWYMVKTSSGQIGWIKSSDVRVKK